jgi:hypothetical protein
MTYCFLPCFLNGLKTKKGVVNKCYFELKIPVSPVQVRSLAQAKVAQMVRAGAPQGVVHLLLFTLFFKELKITDAVNMRCLYNIYYEGRIST